jgi:hypothetical protein
MGPIHRPAPKIERKGAGFLSLAYRQASALYGDMPILSEAENGRGGVPRKGRQAKEQYAQSMQDVFQARHLKCTKYTTPPSI